MFVLIKCFVIYLIYIIELVINVLDLRTTFASKAHGPRLLNFDDDTTGDARETRESPPSGGSSSSNQLSPRSDLQRCLDRWKGKFKVAPPVAPA